MIVHHYPAAGRRLHADRPRPPMRLRLEGVDAATVRRRYRQLRTEGAQPMGARCELLCEIRGCGGRVLTA